MYGLPGKKYPKYFTSNFYSMRALTEAGTSTEDHDFLSIAEIRPSQKPFTVSFLVIHMIVCPKLVKSKMLLICRSGLRNHRIPCAEKAVITLELYEARQILV